MKKIISIFLIIIPIALPAQLSDFNDTIVKTVVLIEKKVGSKIQPHGTGFILYDYNSALRYIVTNKHIIGKHKSLYVSLPLKGMISNKKIILQDDNWEVTNNNIRGKVDLIPDSTVVFSRNYDLAVFKMEIPSHIVLSDNNDSISVERLSIPRSGILKLNQVEVGTDVYFIGFPFHIGTEIGYAYDTTRLFSDIASNPLVRKGLLSWKSERSNEFLIDGFSFGGNSGSPVITKIDRETGRSYLIGIVQGHLSEYDTTLKHSDYIKYNAGLARCISSDQILNLIEIYKEKCE